MKAFQNRTIVFLLTSLGLAWLGKFAVGKIFADAVASRFGAKILQAGGGKISDASMFVSGRISDALVMATSVFALGITVLACDALLRRAAFYRQARGLWLGLLVFFAVNAAVAVANRTALFWFPFFDSTTTDNYAQFQIKRSLLEESPATNRFVLLGNSQTSSNLSEQVLNSSFGGDAWFTELHQSGVHGFDMLIIERELRGTPAQTAIIYVTPIYFYGGTNGKVASRFFGFGDVPDIVRLGGWSAYPEGSLRTGLFGRAFPLYRHNASFSQRVFGAATTGIAQRRYDKSLESDLDAQARRRAESLTTETETERKIAALHTTAFKESIGALAARHRVVLIAGRNYPLLEQLEPKARNGMKTILDEIVREHPSVTLLDEQSFFTSKAEDFHDLIHFNEDAQTRFSIALAEQLRRIGKK